MAKPKKNNKAFYHRFLDEAGDTTFYGKGKVPIVGEIEGVSKSFIIGMVKFKQPLQPIREQVITLQNDVTSDPYFKDVPSIQKNINKNGFYFHATDDTPEVRKLFYNYIKTLDLSFEAVVGRKIYDIFNKKHNSNEAEFYADILSHLLKNKLQLNNKLVLNISERGKSTKNNNLIFALEKSINRFAKTKPDISHTTNVVFNIQNQTSEPLLNIADYFCWAIQRVFEKGEARYYNYLEDKISLVIDIYDSSRYEGNMHYYKGKNLLTAENKISQP